MKFLVSIAGRFIKHKRGEKAIMFLFGNRCRVRRLFSLEQTGLALGVLRRIPVGFETRSGKRE